MLLAMTLGQADLLAAQFAFYYIVASYDADTRNSPVLDGNAQKIRYTI